MVGASVYSVKRRHYVNLCSESSAKARSSRRSCWNFHDLIKPRCQWRLKSQPQMRVFKCWAVVILSGSEPRTSAECSDVKSVLCCRITSLRHFIKLSKFHFIDFSVNQGRSLNTAATCPAHISLLTPHCCQILLHLFDSVWWSLKKKKLITVWPDKINQISFVYCYVTVNNVVCTFSFGRSSFNTVSLC